MQVSRSRHIQDISRHNDLGVLEKYSEVGDEELKKGVLGNWALNKKLGLPRRKIESKIVWGPISKNYHKIHLIALPPKKAETLSL